MRPSLVPRSIDLGFRAFGQRRVDLDVLLRIRFTHELETLRELIQQFNVA